MAETSKAHERQAVRNSLPTAGPGCALNPTMSHEEVPARLPPATELRQLLFTKVAGLLQRAQSRTTPSRTTSPPVKQTDQVFLEYDPLTRRKVLNTYEILREIGKGEHGKVKLAKDLVHNELVAIKVVDRRSNKGRPSLRRRSVGAAPDSKIRREIAIMKKCNHKHVVKLREVLDDVSSNKIYLVLEYLEKGEIRWKRSRKLRPPLTDSIPCRRERRPSERRISGTSERKASGTSERRISGTSERKASGTSERRISGTSERKSSGTSERRVNEISRRSSGNEVESDEYVCDLEEDLDQDDYLLSNEYLPNLTFTQARKIFRDVVLGLEYLHAQGVVHRDIKPANLLVLAQNVVKISDFGVSFASTLEGQTVSALELAKTAGTPAFFAPEMCQMGHDSKSTVTDSMTDSTVTESMMGSTTTVDTATRASIVNVSDGPPSIPVPSVTARNRNEHNTGEAFSGKPTESLQSSKPQSSLESKSQGSLESCVTIDHRIDIWALGVTLYCLLFGRVPFNADTEFELFHVICTEELQFPALASSFNSPAPVREGEFELAKDLLSRMLTKDPADRIDIRGIKAHAFTLMDLENDLDLLNEFCYLNAEDMSLPDEAEPVTSVGLGSRLRKSLVGAIRRRSEDDPGRSASPLNHLMILSEEITDERVERVPSRSSSYSFGRILDEEGTLRRGSSSEAPQIETKRNVGGDLYMKNQSAVDAFKGIQRADERRRSSIFLIGADEPAAATSNNLPGSATGSSTGSTLHGSTTGTTLPISTPSVPLASPTPYSDGPLRPAGTPKLTVGPIRISQDRRRSLVMSLPLSGSFASLDSFNDDYLLQQYQEFTRQRRRHKEEGMAPTGVDEFRGGTKMPAGGIDSINAKFQAFDLNRQMAQESGIVRGSGVAEGIAPTQRGSRSSSCLLYVLTSSSASDDDEDLTLAFSLKVKAPGAPPATLRPPMSSRAKSHDLSLLRPGHQHTNSDGAIPTFNVLFHEDEPEFADIPDGLMLAVPRMSILAAMTPSLVAVGPGSSSTATLTAAGMEIADSVATIVEKGGRKEGLGERIGEIGRREDYGKGRGRMVSPLLKNAPAAELASVNSHLAGVGGMKSVGGIRTRFNNHYNKEPVQLPFPHAVHMPDTAIESLKMTGIERASPERYRLNSVTLGILQGE